MRRRAPLLPQEFLSHLRRAMDRGAVHVSPSCVEWDISNGCERPCEIVEPPPQGLRAAILVTKVRCGQCERCMRQRQREWSRRAFIETEKSARTWFVTLTLPTDIHMMYWKMAEKRAEQRALAWDTLSVEERVRFLDELIEPELQLFLKRVRKNSRGKLRFLQVTEPHAGGGDNHGFPHWHLLIHEGVSRETTKRIIRDAWPWGFSTAKLADKKAVLYVAKYASKRLCGRVRASQRYGRPVEASPVGPGTPSGSAAPDGTHDGQAKAVATPRPTTDEPTHGPTTSAVLSSVVTVQGIDKTMGYPVAYRRSTGGAARAGSQGSAPRPLPYGRPANQNVPGLTRGLPGGTPANQNQRAQPLSRSTVARGLARMALTLGRAHPLLRWARHAMDAWQLGEWLLPEQEGIMRVDKPLGFNLAAKCNNPMGPTNYLFSAEPGAPGAGIIAFVNGCLANQFPGAPATIDTTDGYILYSHRDQFGWHQLTELYTRPSSGPVVYHYPWPAAQPWPWWDPMALPILQPVPAPKPRPVWAPRPRPMPEPVPAVGPWPGPVPLHQVLAGRPVDVSLTFTPGQRPVARLAPAGRPAPPPPGVPERKFGGPAGAARGVYVAAVGAYDTVTEAGDFIDALFEALPKAVQDQYKGRTTMAEKAAAIADNFSALDVSQALQNVASNAIEDAVLGRSQGMAGQALGYNPGASRGITGGWSSIMSAGG